MQVNEADVQKYFVEYNVLSLIEEMTKEKIESVRWFIDCGDDDFLYAGNSLVYIALRKRKVPHEFKVRDGAHNWTDWHHSFPEVLKFVSDAFHQY